MNNSNNLKQFALGKDWFNFGYFFLCTTLFLMPFPREYSLYSLGLMLLAGLVGWVKSFRAILLKLSSKWLLILPLVLYFLMQVISILRAENPRYNLIEERLMFLLIPVFIFPIVTHSEFKLLKVFGSFIAGLISVFVYLLFRATLISLFDVELGSTLTNITEGQSSPFFSDSLSYYEHPLYMSLKVLFSIALLLFYFSSRIKVQYVSVLVIVQVIFLILLASRTGIVASFLLGGYYILIGLKNKRKGFKIISLALMICGLTGLSLISNRVKQSLNGFMDYVIVGDSTNWDRVDPRIRVWKASGEIIREFPIFGVGLSKSRESLVAVYERRNLVGEANLRLNAHNQFIEDQVSNGIPGVIILCFVLFGSLFNIRSLSNQNLYGAFLILFVAYSMFESTFNRQWGIMFFTLFYCLLVFPPKSDTVDVKNEDEPNSLTINDSRIS